MNPDINLVAAMNAKEKDLQNQIKFYKENREQLLRIKSLEEELDTLKAGIEKEYKISSFKQQQNDIQSEYIKYCKENCKVAFDTLMYQNNHNKMMNSKTTTKNNIYINVEMKIQMNRKMIRNGIYIFQYTFDKFGDIYNVICNIEGTGQTVTGIYSPESGFVEN